MLVLITYDVNTSDTAGRGRLRRITKECVNYGQRVQNSVFECLLDTAQCRKLQNELCKIIDPEKDSLRFYYLGKKYENRTLRLQADVSARGTDDLIVRSTSAQRSLGRFAPKIRMVFLHQKGAECPDRRHSVQKHLKFVCYRKNVHSDLYTFAVAPRKGRVG